MNNCSSAQLSVMDVDGAFTRDLEDNLEDSHTRADQPCMQNFFVMRHGHRLDDFDRKWVYTAPRPWDPPLTEAGKMRAWDKGKKLRAEGWNITRILCSPFLRCVQTAVEVTTALCLLESSSDSQSSRGAIIDPSMVKVSIEYGLAEVMNRLAIRCGSIPPQGPSTLEIAELYALFPAGTTDISVQAIWPKLPSWVETMDAAHSRYSSTFQAAADMFPRENILCVTHGEGVGVSVAMRQRVHVYGVDYCGYSHAQRPIYSFSSDSVKAGEFELLTEPDQSGVFF
eukprot:c24210_g1_i1 orf=255-1103(+)